MYLTQITVKNLRSLADIDLKLDEDHLPGWTVIAGHNGSGKTTLLQAVALGFDDVVSRYVDLPHWVRKDCPNATVSITVLDRPNALQKGIMVASNSLTHHVKIWPTDHTMKYKSIQPNTKNKSCSFFSGYGPFRRLSGHTSDAQKQMADNRPSNVVTLFREDASLSEAMTWLREVEFRRLAAKDDQKERTYSRLKDVALGLLGDGLLPADIRIDDVDADGLWVYQGDERLLLDQLSDGCRAVAGLVLDMLRHMAKIFGALASTPNPSGGLSLPYPGLVLIDEVESHLHPAWQRRIGPWLTTHFPNIQFIVTTHSPFICQSAKSGGLFQMSLTPKGAVITQIPEQDYYDIVNGAADDVAVSKLFGLEYTHSDQAEQLKERVAELEFKLMEGALSPDENNELESLSAQLPKGGSSAVERAVRRLGGD